MRVAQLATTRFNLMKRNVLRPGNVAGGKLLLGANIDNERSRIDPGPHLPGARTPRRNGATNQPNADESHCQDNNDRTVHACEYLPVKTKRKGPPSALHHGGIVVTARWTDQAQEEDP